MNRAAHLLLETRDTGCMRGATRVTVLAKFYAPDVLRNKEKGTIQALSDRTSNDTRGCHAGSEMDSGYMVFSYDFDDAKGKGKCQIAWKRDCVGWCEYEEKTNRRPTQWIHLVPPTVKRPKTVQEVLGTSVHDVCHAIFAFSCCCFSCHWCLLNRINGEGLTGHGPSWKKTRAENSTTYRSDAHERNNDFRTDLQLLWNPKDYGGSAQRSRNLDLVQGSSSATLCLHGSISVRQPTPTAPLCKHVLVQITIDSKKTQSSAMSKHGRGTTIHTLNQREATNAFDAQKEPLHDGPTPSESELPAVSDQNYPGSLTGPGNIERRLLDPAFNQHPCKTRRQSLSHYARVPSHVLLTHITSSDALDVLRTMVDDTAVQRIPKLQYSRHIREKFNSDSSQTPTDKESDDLKTDVPLDMVALKSSDLRDSLLVSDATPVMASDQAHQLDEQHTSDEQHFFQHRQHFQ